MTKDEIKAKASAKPAPFTAAGVDVILRPLTYDERTEAVAAYRAEKGTEGDSLRLQKRLAALALRDDDGKPLFTVDEVGTLDPRFVDAVAREVAKRSGVVEGDDPKAPSTPTPN